MMFFTKHKLERYISLTCLPLMVLVEMFINISSCNNMLPQKQGAPKIGFRLSGINYGQVKHQECCQPICQTQMYDDFTLVV